uniref:Uncharacterized protein n=1 Tax=Daucus carota subsp. sativus TaxID=79200 RepID=A0A162A4I3_DAUCS
MEGSDSTNQNNPTTNRGDIPDLDICFCDKLMVGRTCWFDENTGRRMLACPDRKREKLVMMAKEHAAAIEAAATESDIEEDP